MKRRYLYRKLAISVFGAAFLFAGLTAVIFFWTEFKRSSEKTVVMLNQLLDTVENTAAIAAYTGNPQIGEDVLGGLLRNDIVHEARLSNDRGLELRQTRPTEISEPTEVSRDLHAPFGDGDVVGRLTVIPEAQFNLQEARYSALINALNSSLLIGVTALIVLTLVRSSLSLPLMKVSDTLHAITAGEQQRLAPLRRHGDDELGQLVQDINRLLGALEDKFQAEQSLREEIQAIERQLRGIFETTSAGIFILDATGRLLTANPTLERVLALQDLSPAQPGRQDFLASAFAEPERVRELMRQADERGRAVSLDLQLKQDGDGPGGWVHCLFSCQTDKDGSKRFEGVVYDITARRAAEARIRYEADHDTLTSLLRRRAGERELAKLMKGTREGDRTQVVMLLDLDNFKPINDRHGHDAGDSVLIETARRLKSCVRTGDIVARFGGDEFLIVLVNCVPVERAQQIARDIIVEITKPIRLNPELTVQVGISIGMAIHDRRDQTMEELFKKADDAMYEVKRQGKNGFGVVQPDGTVVVDKV